MVGRSGLLAFRNLLNSSTPFISLPPLSDLGSIISRRDYRVKRKTSFSSKGASPLYMTTFAKIK
jgi:hypothetical protein